MTTPATLVADLQARGVTLEPRGDKLAVRPVSRLTRGELDVLRAHKAEVLRLLAPPVPDPVEPAAGLSAASLADWAARGEVVTLLSRTLAGSVYLAPSPAAVRELVEAGVPRHRVYLPGELAGLRALFSLASPQRTEAIRVLDALREVFDGEVEVVTCSICHGTAWWRSTAGQTVCRRCHPPAPGAEAVP